MNQHHSSRSIGVLASVAIAVVAALAVLASGVLGGAGASPRPSTSPPSAPVPNPSSKPSSPPVVDQPPVGPTDDAGDGLDYVELINLPGVDSSVVIWDESDSLADAWSGTPDRDGPVARDVIEAAASVDEETVRLTWSDLPIASRAQLSIHRTSEGKYHFRLFRPAHAGPTDNVVFDRVLNLKFHASVPAEDVVVELVEGLAPSAGVGLVQGGLTTSGGTGLTIAIWDETDGLAAASINRVEGTPSVGPDTVLIVNDDGDTLRLTWADPDVATYAKLSIRMGDNGRYQLRLVRERPQGPTMPVAHERVLLLNFLVAVPAEDVDIEVIDGMLNEG